MSACRYGFVCVDLYVCVDVLMCVRVCGCMCLCVNINNFEVLHTEYVLKHTL